MNKRPHHKGIKILIAAAIVAAATLLVFLIGGRSVLNGVMGVITTPVRSALSSFSGWIEDRYNYAFRYDELLRENEELKKYIAELEEAARVGQDAIEENERLRDVLGLPERYSSFVYESAKITARGSTNWSSTLTLDKGSKHGIAVDNCVMDQYGNLVGVVTEVGYNWCTVLSLIDTDTELGAMIARTNSPAIAEGDFALMAKGQLKLSYLPENISLLSGDEVLSSGMGGVYPPGLKLGMIHEILTDDSGMDRYAVISPSAELEDLRQVFIIKQFDVVD